MKKSNFRIKEVNEVFSIEENLGNGDWHEPIAIKVKHEIWGHCTMGLNIYKTLDDAKYALENHIEFRKDLLKTEPIFYYLD